MAKNSKIRQKVAEATKSSKQQVKEAAVYKPSLAELEYLTPGSNWKNARGFVNTVLFVANEHVPAEHQSRFPLTVVFADEEGNIFAVPRDTFLAKRSFHNVQPEVELAVEELQALLEEDLDEASARFSEASTLIPSDEDAEEDEDDEEELSEDAKLSVRQAFDSLHDGNHPIIQASQQSIAEQAQKALEQPNYLYVRFDASAPWTQNSGAPVLTIQQLTSNVVAYHQSADVSNPRFTIHQLTFRLDSIVTEETLLAAFSPEDAKENDRQYYPVFSVGHSEVGLRHRIDWDYLVGVFPAYYDNSKEYFADVTFVTESAEDGQTEEGGGDLATTEQAQEAVWKTGAEDTAQVTEVPASEVKDVQVAVATDSVTEAEIKEALEKQPPQEAPAQ